MPRKTTLKGIKRKADQVFSEYIRRLKSDKSGNCTCVTCGIIKPWKEMQCGHYFPRNRLGTRYHEDNCHIQCSGCNVFKHGNYTAYAYYMYKEYGSAFMEDLGDQARRSVKISVSEYQEMIKGWKQMLGKMK